MVFLYQRHLLHNVVNALFFFKTRQASLLDGILILTLETDFGKTFFYYELMYLIDKIIE
jgi:hypothetical protein